MPLKEKVCPTIDAAVADIPDGATIMFGGFGGAGFPNNLIQGLARQGARNLGGEGSGGAVRFVGFRRIPGRYPGGGAEEEEDVQEG